MRGVVAGLLVAGLLAVPASAGAQAPLPVGEADGVRIGPKRHQVVFTPRATKLWRRVAGRQVILECTRFVRDGAEIAAIDQWVPKRGRRISLEGVARRSDYCTISLAARRNGRDDRLLVSIPLTQRGAVFLDERERTLALLAFLFVGGAITDGSRFLTAEELLAKLPRLQRLLTPLAGPTETPPPDKLGYWSDGARHVAVVTLSASGRRLFIEYEGDVLHTNVAEHLFGLQE